MRPGRTEQPVCARAHPGSVAIVAVAVLLATWQPLVAQGAPPEARRMSVSWSSVPIQDVLRAFAVYSGMSIVAGTNVSTTVTADINDQPWDVALHTILSVHGLVASENEYGIIRVENMADVADREVVEPLLTRTYRTSYQRASELQGTVAPLLSGRGSVSIIESSNTLVVTDIARVQHTIASLLR